MAKTKLHLGVSTDTTLLDWDTCSNHVAGSRSRSVPYQEVCRVSSDVYSVDEFGHLQRMEASFNQGVTRVEYELDWDRQASSVLHGELEVLQLVLLEMTQKAARVMRGVGQIRFSLRLSPAILGADLGTGFVDSSGSGVTLSLCDTGHGKSATILERTFVSGNAIPTQGIGFGLYFVKRVLDLQVAEARLEQDNTGGLRAILWLKEPSQDVGRSV